MSRRRSVVMTGALVTAMSAIAVAVAASDFKTARPAQLVALEPGVVIDPILSTGDIVPGTENASEVPGQPPDNPAYQMSGIPDGLGAFASNDDRYDYARLATKDDDDDDDDGGHHGGHGKKRPIDVLMNHELAGTRPPGVGGRISQVTIDAGSHRVLDAWYPIDGSEGFIRFCSSTLDFINGRALYFTGEESTSEGALTPNPDDGLGRGGSSLVVDASNGTWRETRHFGLLSHENNVPLHKLSKAVVLITEDGDPGPTNNNSQLYAYIAPTWKTAINGRRGSLYVWKADSVGDGNPSTNDIREGQTLTGRFVPVSQAENANSFSLERAAQTRAAFDFVRLEDASPSRTKSNRVFVADTGALGSESTRGRMYQLDFDSRDPRRMSLTLPYDADKRATSSDRLKLVNPDNIETTERSIIIQEDRNAEHRGAEVETGYSRILVYDIGSRKITRAVARPATTSARPGDWESSGVIDAERLLGKDWFLVDVQAHTADAAQPGPGVPGRNPPPNTSTGEDGQLLAIKIPRA